MSNLPKHWLVLNENKDPRLQEKVIPYINKYKDDDYYEGRYHQYYGIDINSTICLSHLNKPPARFTILTVDEFIELTENQNKTYELW